MMYSEEQNTAYLEPDDGDDMLVGLPPGTLVVRLLRKGDL